MGWRMTIKRDDYPGCAKRKGLGRRLQPGSDTGKGGDP